MRERIRRTLDRIAENDALERQWLRTLSLLEFIGARKIGKTAAAHHPSRAVLEHWADETRHAAVFAALAEEGVEGGAPDYLCGEEAKAYFAALDAALASRLAALSAGTDPSLVYLLVTAVIERRAMVLYPLYKAATRRASVREALGRVVVEEQAHRVTIEETCRVRLSASEGRLFEEGLAQEEKLFETFWDAMDRKLPVAPPIEAELRPKASAHPG